jgi:hypothetical protein
LGEDPARHATWRFDALWKAACSEASALEAWAEDCTPETIARDLDRAEQYLEDAA